jgi:hypothetical protein
MRRLGRQIKARQLIRFGCVLSVISFAGASAAQEADEGWRFTLSPYLWGAGISGTSGALPPLPPAEVDLSFSDILDDLRFAGMIAGSAQKGRFGITADIQYVDTQNDGDLRPIYARTQLTSKTFLATLTGEYAVLATEAATLFVGGGFRVWSVETDLKLRGGPAADRGVDHNDTWVDPVLTLRGEANLSERWFVAGWAGVGGFGVGSDIMADLFGSVGYRITPATSVSVGYRWMKVDRDEDGFLYDVEQQGPMAGMTFRF